MLTRVIGPPGTGKTSWVQTFVAGLPHRSLLLASHTRTAARVLAARIDDVNPEAIGTLHSHAYRALGRPPVAEAGKLAREWNQRAPRDDWRIGAERDPGDPLGTESREGELFAEFQRWRESAAPDADPPPRFAALARAWAEFKAEFEAVDFVDMLTLPVRRGLPPPLRPAVLIVDEAQDLTPAGWALVRHWARFVDEVVVAGDPAQTIYEWAGASPAPLFEEGWGELLLDRSHRLPGEVHRFAETLLLQHSGPMSRGRWYRPRPEDGEVRRAGIRLRETDSVIRLIQELPGTTMVLTTCGYMLRPLMAALRDAGLPWWNPYRRADTSLNPLREEVGEGRISTVSRVLSFLRPHPEVWGDDARLWQSEDFAVWLRMLRADQFAERGARERLLANPPALNIDMVADALVDEARAGMADLRLDWLAQAALRDYRGTIEFMAAIARRGGFSRLRQRPQLILGTIHSVKGGEADNVIISPDLSLQGAESLATRNGQDAMIRLMYTGATRARERLVILEPSGRLACGL